MIKKAGIIAPLIVFILYAASPESSAKNRLSCPDGNRSVIVIEIDYGNALPSRIVKVPCVKGKTVLGALQAIAAVDTAAVGPYVFVTSIDGIIGKKGEKAWYYYVDGQPSKELAHWRILNGNERVKWVYTKDVCSCTVDGAHGMKKKGVAQ